MAKCLQVLKVCKTADERQDYAFDLTKEFSRRWERDWPYAALEIIRPNENPGTGLEYASSGGVSNGELEPEWTTEVGETVEDGSLEWTAQAVTFGGLRHRISSVVWAAPTGIVASDQIETDHPAMQETRVWVSGGTRGRRYLIVGLVETDTGAFFECRIDIKIE